MKRVSKGMKKDRNLERIASIVSMSFSLFMMYGIGKYTELPDYFLCISILFGVVAIVCAGILE